MTRDLDRSDWPVWTLAASCTDVVAYTQALTAALGEAEQTAVWSGTAARVYRVTVDQPVL